MKRRYTVIAFMIALLLALILTPLEAPAQPSYWLALNFRLTFYGNGTVLVEELLHPFTPEGKSLLEDKEVESDLKNSTAELLRYVLLMLTEYPEKLHYRLGPVLDKRYGEEVHCDVSGTGSMTRFAGAYVLTAVVYLNTSSFVEDLGNNTFRISVRDSFTSSDPRSWIDVIIFRFGDAATVLQVRWAPAYAQGPSKEGENTFVWMNTNELEAPDFYIFTVKLPGLKYVGVPPEVKAAILSARFADGRATVELVNTGTSSGYVIVWLKGSGVDQARKVFLNPGEKTELVFQYVPPGNYTVTLISGASVLDEKILAETAVRQDYGVPRLVDQWLLAALLACVAGTVVLLLAFRSRARSHPQPQNPTA